MSFNNRRSRQTENVRNPKKDLQASKDLFRRSRTLTGSISSKVASAAEGSAILKSPRLEEHDLRKHRRKLTGILFVLIILSGAILYLISTVVLDIKVQTNNLRGSQYKSEIDSYFRSYPLERSTLTLNDSRLNKFVQSKLPDVESVELVKDDGYNVYHFVVIPRMAVARWQLGDKNYYVDANGIAFENAQNTSGLINIKDESGLPLAAQQVASRSMMQFIGRVVGQIHSRGGGKVVEVIIPPATLKQVDILLEGRPYRIKLNIDRVPSEQAIDIINTLKYIDNNSITPEYIDSRVSGKSFYR